MREFIVKQLTWLADWVGNWGKDKSSSTPVLLPLIPKYDRDKHGIYFDVIEAALNEAEVRNIALTGRAV